MPSVVSPSDRSTVMMMPMQDQALPPAPAPVTAQVLPVISESFAKDAIIAWFRGEFAAANAIIDALCSHLNQLSAGDGGGGGYEAVFEAIHRRRLNWIPILQMQKYYSIADVAIELRKAAAAKETGEGNGGDVAMKDCVKEASDESEDGGGKEEAPEEKSEESNDGSQITDEGKRIFSIFATP